MMNGVGRSLRARLLWFLLGAIVLAAGTQAYVAYRTVLKEADDIFDYHMQQMALSLRAGLPPSAAVSGLGSGEENFEFVVQVWTASGTRIFESAAEADLPQRAVLGFSNVQARGTTYRVFSMQTGALVIQVAQDMAARRHMAGTLALRTVGPIALAAPLLMLVVWWVVSRSLAPVARVRRQVASRQADDLSPVSESGLPEEVRPLVHELNLLFDRVRKAFEAQKHFVADAAHELRSPLAALKLQVQGLQRASDDAARDVAVGRLVLGIDRATRLVEQMLALARHEANAAAGATPALVSLQEVARLAISDAIADAQARRIDVGLSRSDSAEVRGESEALRMLVRNLLDNAVKYTPEGGRVDVGIEAVGAGAELVVEDSGPGLPDGEATRVLDRFYRSGEPRAPGSGLGLAIVKSIADLHGATVALDRSERLGGLRVAVRFPSAA
ncbi:MAG: sensor histidine kinase N-terminal domain-containing protein [Gammaproteobacteria bacterium]|nr:sensor histidine kinase N-terminal domain-containing protein [Gammaproteobacteria bacterium]MBU1442367.1 sensor histidine kinase N-terminal domain-containing protein [Gammaproteobacteria bacterium]MBU2409358.1 sensor histidine kinase N-terminal domain-containing protein [Gammaproteobacteria bacterium]